MKISMSIFASIVTICLVLIIANLFFLNYKIFFVQETTLQPKATPTSSSLSQLKTVSEPTTNLSGIYSVIEEATASLTRRIDTLSIPPPPPPAATIQPATQTVKEYYIPLGYGSTNSTEWIDLPGVEAYVAPQNYGVITQMYFEAGITIPTGNGQVYARLKNVTDNNSLIESEVMREGSKGGLVSSGKIPLPSTTKLYRVQLKSSLGAEVKLDSARIKIFVQ